MINRGKNRGWSPSLGVTMGLDQNKKWLIELQIVTVKLRKY